MPIAMVLPSLLAFTPSSLLHLLLIGFLKLKSWAKEELQCRQILFSPHYISIFYYISIFTSYSNKFYIDFVDTFCLSESPANQFNLLTVFRGEKKNPLSSYLSFFFHTDLIRILYAFPEC